MSSIERDRPELAESYDRVSDSQFKRGVLLARQLGIGAGATVLDVGCGTGRLALYLAPIVGPGGRVAGIDPSPHRVDLARQKLQGGAAPNVAFAIGSAESPGPFPPASFDYILYCSVFHWIDDKPAALREACRLLKPGGAVGITTVDRGNPSAFRAIRNRLLAQPPYFGQVDAAAEASKPVTAKELEALLAGAGFADIGIKVRESIRYYSAPEEVFAFSEASSFGNFLGNVPEGLRPRARKDLAAELEKLRTPQGIELVSPAIYAFARRP